MKQLTQLSFLSRHCIPALLLAVTTLVAAVSLRWKWWVALLALLASVPPLVTLPLEIWLRRTGRLARRPRA